MGLKSLEVNRWLGVYAQAVLPEDGAEGILQW